MIFNLNAIIDLKIKVKIFFIFLLNLFSSILEVISIGSIPILLLYILSPDKIADKIPNENLKSLLSNFLDSNSKDENIFFILIGIVILFLFKNLYFFLIGVYQSYFQRKFITTYTTKLFNTYLSEKYEFFLNNNPAQIIKNIESCQIIYKVIYIVLNLFREISIVIGLIVVVMFQDLYISGIIITLSLFFFFFHRVFFLKILKKQGKKQYEFQEKKISIINEFYSSILDIKLLNKEKFFSKKMNLFSWKHQTANTIQSIINFMTRPVLETGSIILIVTIISYYLSAGKDFNEIIPFITLLTLSFIRIMPSANSIIADINSYRFQSNQASLIINDLKNKNDNLDLISDIKNVHFNKSINLKNIYFNYQNQTQKNLININLEILKNDRIAIIGKTGSGKSTLLNVLCGLLDFSSGEIIFDGTKKILRGKDFFIKNLYYVKQDVHLINDTLKKNIAFGVDDEDIDPNLVLECLKKVGLGKFLNNLNGLNQIIGNKGSKISGGERQLLGLARALYRKPKIILLDEPTSNLDYKTESLYYEIISKLNITTIIVAHRISTLEYCNKIVLLKDGSIQDQGSYSYYKKKYDNLKKYIE